MDDGRQPTGLGAALFLLLAGLMPPAWVLGPQLVSEPPAPLPATGHAFEPDEAD